MFRERTLFIVGAGASHEAGLPTGLKLRREIIDCLDYQQDDWGHVRGTIKPVWDAILSKLSGNTVAATAAVNAIRLGLNSAESIDSFLDTHSKDFAINACGKIAIVYCIAAAERRSRLAELSLRQTDDFEKSWYPLLSRNMFSGLRV